MTTISSNSYFLKEEFLTGRKSRGKSNASNVLAAPDKSMAIQLGASKFKQGKHANLSMTANLTPSVKLKGVGFESTPLSKLLSSVDSSSPKPLTTKDFHQSLDRVN